MRTVHLLIKGRVQGVSYRAYAQEQAEALSITGWVRNSEDGSVEATITGADNAVHKFIEWCRKGPRLARVTDVQVTPKPEEQFIDFKIIRG